MTDLSAKAEAFHALHRGERPLLLFNAWDIPSARAISASAAAVATSSGAVAAARGYQDGEKLPTDELIGFVARLTRLVDKPVTIDFEAGYGATPEAISDNVARLIEAGAVGINFEDGLVSGERKLGDAGRHAAAIAAIRARAQDMGIAFFVNARTDSFLLNGSDQRAALDEALRRGAIYRDAGADGLFVPGLTALPLIGELTNAIPLPVNIMAVDGIASVAQLAAAGVRRISCGAWPMMSAMQWTARAAAALHRDGLYPSATAAQ